MYFLASLSDDVAKRFFLCKNYIIGCLLSKERFMSKSFIFSATLALLPLSAVALEQLPPPLTLFR